MPSVEADVPGKRSCFPESLGENCAFGNDIQGNPRGFITGYFNDRLLPSDRPGLPTYRLNREGQDIQDKEESCSSCPSLLMLCLETVALPGKLTEGLPDR